MSESEHGEANKRLLWALVVGVLLLVGFSLVVSLWYDANDVKPNEKFWDWLIAVLGTLLSFILGLAAGFLHLNRQNAVTQKRRRNHLSDLLEVELQETVDVSNTNKQPNDVTLMYRQPLILEEAAKSGLFDRELSTDMLKLAKTYHEYNDRVTTLRATGEPRSIEPPESLVSDTKQVLENLRRLKA